MEMEKIKEYIDAAKIVCFDIFDTLISRVCYPDYTKKAWAIYVRDVFNLDMSHEDLLNLRNKAESILYNSNKEKYGEAEYKYNDLIRNIYDSLKIDVPYKIFLSKCIDIEVSIEKKVQFVKDGVIEVLKYCKKNKKRVMCVSDMYLSSDMLKDIFTYHGLDEYISEIYVSSDLYKTKRNGTIYTYLAKKLKEKPDNFLMIGDNHHSDYVNAKEAEWNAYHINNEVIERMYEKNKSNYTENSILKRFMINYENNEKVFNEEYKLYNVIYDTYMYMYKNNIKDIKIDDDNLYKRFNFLKNECWLINDISYKKSGLVISVSDGRVVVSSKDKVIFEEVVDFSLLKLSTFEQLVDLLLNKSCSRNKLSELMNHERQDKKISLELNSIKKGELISLGRSYSYLFYRFANWILQDLKENEIDEIYFFTREGEFYKQIFDVIKPTNIKSEILEVSRVATFCASIREVTTEELKRIWSLYSSQSMKAFCKSLDIPLESISDLLTKYNICACEEIIYPFNDYRVKKLFADKKFKDIIQGFINSKKELILEYFKSKGLTSKKKKVAIVDIGWRGTIQDNVCYLLPNTMIRGYYFALYDFLNKQPDNSSKVGFLNQFKGGMKYLNNITPFEMLCNSPNGSTICYSKENGIHAIRKIDEKENESYTNCIEYVQRGIISEIKDNKNNLDSTDNLKIFDVLTNIIYQPNYDVANAYFNLKHNEEFGVGDYVYKKKKFHYTWPFLAVFLRRYRRLFRESLIDSSWPQGFLKIHNMGFLNQYYKKKSLCKGDEEYMSTKKKRIAWIIPHPIKGSGGHRTILQNANALVRNGYECDLYIDEDFISTAEGMKKKLITYFDECLCDVYVGAKLRKEYDLVFATHAILTTDYVKAAECENKAYFIQDFEPWFMPMGDTYLSMERSYKYNFKGASIGRWLANKIKTEYGSEVKYFNFCANLDVYKPLKDVEKENAICFIFQPEKPRRCYDMGLKALKLVKALRPDIKIYLYGSPDKMDVGFECENLHIIPITECNKLYNKCKAGLCISASNPSRIPFEMMAAGLPVVDLYRENNLYDMPDGGVLLADSTPEAIATALISIIDDEKLAQKMSKFGLKFMKDYPLEEGFEKFLSIVESMFDKEFKNTESIDKIYKKGPVLPSEEVKSISHLIEIVPAVHKSGPLVRKMVRVKKGIGRRVRRVLGK